MSKFTTGPDTYENVRAIIRNHGQDRGRLIEALHEIHDTLGYLPDPVLAMIADGFGLSKVDVLGVATFFPRFQFKSRARYTIQCCTSVVCELCRGSGIREALQKHLKIRLGETTRDGLFLLRGVTCLGACDRSPAIMINQRLFAPVREADLAALLQQVATHGLGDSQK
jgi:NADH-quinone oxidoreductase subunit E